MTKDNSICDVLDLSNEIWKPITCLEFGYEASNFGRIKSVKRLVSTQYSPRVVKPRLIKSSSDNAGYQVVGGIINGVKKIVKVHRLIAITFIPNPQNKPQVNHINGIKHDNRLCNLEWVTAKENRIHSRDNKLQINTKGNECSWSKLSDSKVLAIRRLYRMNPNFNRRKISKKLNVSPGLITMVVKGSVWKHIKPKV